MALIATVPPRSSAFRALITTSPLGAKVTAASRCVEVAARRCPPRRRRGRRPAAPPRGPGHHVDLAAQKFATWIAMVADAPKP